MKEDFKFIEDQGYTDVKRILGEKNSKKGLFIAKYPLTGIAGASEGGFYQLDRLGNFTITTYEDGFVGVRSFLGEVEK